MSTNQQRIVLAIPQSQGGFALIVVMLALMALSMLGLTAVTMTNRDYRLAQNVRRHHQVWWGAQVGLDRARGETAEMVSDDYLALMAQFTSGGCISDWFAFDTATLGNPEVADIMSTGAYNLADYGVQVCYRVCSKSVAGWELSSDRNFNAVFLDWISTAQDLDALGAARSGILNRQGGLVRIVGQDLCGW